MGVILHAHYRLMGLNGQKIVMPAPVDRNTPNASWWWDRLASQAVEFRRSGFSAVLLPPFCKTASGAAADADGYGLFDNYDIGSKNQFFNIPTRFGDRERLERMIGIMHACGLDIYADVVMHQYFGGDNGTYRYFGADGKTLDGRFPKQPSCFVGSPPRVPVDPVADPTGNFAFGDMVSYINSTPKDYMLSGAIDAADWLTRTLDLQGYRIDDVKGMAVEAVRRFLNSKSMAGRFAVGEYFDGNPSALHWWVWNSGMGGRSNVFDFTLHWTIQAMCNNNSRWWRESGYFSECSQFPEYHQYLFPAVWFSSTVAHSQHEYLYDPHQLAILHPVCDGSNPGGDMRCVSHDTNSPYSGFDYQGGHGSSHRYGNPV